MATLGRKGAVVPAVVLALENTSTTLLEGSTTITTITTITGAKEFRRATPPSSSTPRRPPRSPGRPAFVIELGAAVPAARGRASSTTTASVATASWRNRRFRRRHPEAEPVRAYQTSSRRRESVHGAAHAAAPEEGVRCAWWRGVGGHVGHFVRGGCVVEGWRWLFTGIPLFLIPMTNMSTTAVRGFEACRAVVRVEEGMVICK